MVDEERLDGLVGRFFDRVVLRRPGVFIVLVLAVVALLGWQARKFRLDASAETLVLEGDEDLLYARQVVERFGQSDYLVVTFRPSEDLFSDAMLEALKQLRDELRALERVQSVRTLLDVPLMESPPISLGDLTKQLRSLELEDVDRQAARRELSSSPLYRNLLLSEDGRTAALLILFEPDTAYSDLRLRRNALLDKAEAGTLTTLKREELEQVEKAFRRQKDLSRAQRHEDIAAIRGIMDRYRGQAELFLGGVSMIADDLISYIKGDLRVFGAGVLVFMVATLGLIFQRLRWVAIPVACCVASVICTTGLLGLLGWEVTVISSNFISLQLVLTMSIGIHLVVRYRERLEEYPRADQRRLVLDTVRLKWRPCLYAVLTTVAGFGSLIFCNILPVIMFGWMMTAALLISLVVSFLLFPTVLELLGKDRPARCSWWHTSLTGALAGLTERHGKLILLVGAAMIIGSVAGMLRLRAENCFIDYFKDTTEIYRGMKVIDQQLGGTTPLDVIVDFGGGVAAKDDSGAPTDTGKMPVPPGEVDDFDTFSDLDEAAGAAKYWFTAEKVRRIKQVHEYLESVKETGKVISLATLVEVIEKIKGGPLDSLELALLYNETPDEFRDILIRPYVSVEHGEARFWVRVRDSEPTLRRDALLKRMDADLHGKLGFHAGEIRLAGLLVLYNNMLQSLFRSQILTLGITVLVLSGAFWVLFRSARVAALAMVPNILPVATVLGVMGWLNIPLDMMTITIAAISVGIAVDDTIHYIHRFKAEFAKDRHYVHTMHRCHHSIGRAMYYTSLTIIVGFSILVLSNFVPGVYFGLLTGLAMLIALLADLTLLPCLLIVVKPFGRGCNEA